MSATAPAPAPPPANGNALLAALGKNKIGAAILGILVLYGGLDLSGVTGGQLADIERRLVRIEARLEAQPSLEQIRSMFVPRQEHAESIRTIREALADIKASIRSINDKLDRRQP